jgi:uncharacterized protein
MRRSRGICLAVVAALGTLSAAGPDVRLLDALKNDNRETARALVRAKVDVNVREADGTTALHWAVRADDLETVQLLIRAGANVNAANRYGLTPLSLAATNGSADLAAALLDAGANANAATPAGETVLMTAARTGNAETVSRLLAKGADVNAKESSFGETALMWAAAEDHPAVVTLLAQHGADLNAVSDLLSFPNAKVDIATMVITALPRGGLTPLMYAARQGSLEATRALAAAGADLARTDPDGMSALVMAIINAHYDVAALLAEKGADPDLADATGMGALYALVDMHTLDPLINRPPPKPTGQVDAIDLAKILLAHKANPNAALKAPLLARQHNSGDPTLGAGATPLMRAARNGDLPLMRLLLEKGADPNRRTRAGMTALLFSMAPGRRKSAKDAVEAVKACLDGGADVNAVNEVGETPLHAAVAQGPAMVALLAERGAKLDVKDKQGRTPLDVAISAGAAAPGARGGGRGGRGGAGGSREETVALLRKLMKVN